MDRPSGSFMVDGKGNLVPNPDDEAMKARSQAAGKKEVKKDAEK